MNGMRSRADPGERRGKAMETSATGLTADIQIGTRSVFMYLVRGLVRGINEAMREP